MKGALFMVKRYTALGKMFTWVLCARFGINEKAILVLKKKAQKNARNKL